MRDDETVVWENAHARIVESPTMMKLLGLRKGWHGDSYLNHEAWQRFWNMDNFDNRVVVLPFMNERETSWERFDVDEMDDIVSDLRLRGIRDPYYLIERKTVEEYRLKDAGKNGEAHKYKLSNFIIPIDTLCRGITDSHNPTRRSLEEGVRKNGFSHLAVVDSHGQPYKIVD